LASDRDPDGVPAMRHGPDSLSGGKNSQYDALTVVADAEGMPISKAIRDGIDMLLDERAADPAFQRRLNAATERRRKALELLLK
jgi:hypothetical protein